MKRVSRVSSVAHVGYGASMRNKLQAPLCFRFPVEDRRVSPQNPVLHNLARDSGEGFGVVTQGET